MSDFKTTFENFMREKQLSPDAMQNKFVDRLDDVLSSLSKPTKKSWFGKAKNVKGLYAWGGVGRGKTMIMDLFYQSLPFPEKRRVHFNIFMLDVHNSMKILREDGKGRDPLPQIAKEIAASVRVLCFDEFQVYDIADAMVLSELFKALFKEGVTVIATSNVAPENLYKDGLQRSRFLPFIPLVKDNMGVIHIDSPTDYRQQALNDDGVYFLNNEQKMLNLFDRLAGAEELTATTIDVKGRAMPIEKSFDDMAWLNFDELCEKPRAAVDYQALSNAYETIFINQVPCMDDNMRNQCKRFILLIDTLYDAQKRVVINAEKPPIDLYNGEDHAFEFERTISRLLEMQGEEYLSNKKGRN